MWIICLNERMQFWYWSENDAWHQKVILDEISILNYSEPIFFENFVPGMC